MEDDFSDLAQDHWDTPDIGQPLWQLLCKTIEPREAPHNWLPAGVTLLAGKAKVGKSTLAEQIAEEVSLNSSVLYLALEYNERMVQQRFARFQKQHRLHMVCEGQMKRMGAGGEAEFEDLLLKVEPSFVVIDLLSKIKRRNTGHYDAEYTAMGEIKELIDKFDTDCLVITQSGKPNGSDSDDPFDKIMASTALHGAADNLMIMLPVAGSMRLLTKGRMIPPSEKILEFCDGVYIERTNAGAALENMSPFQAKILDLLQKAPTRQSELVTVLNCHKSQVSAACKALESQNRIKRTNINSPWELV